VPDRPRRAALWIAAGLVAAAAVAAAVWLARSLDARVERALERIGRELLGTDVAIARVDVDLRGGRATLYGLEVANPRGERLAFSGEPALRSDRIDVTFDARSLLGDGPIVLTDVRVRAPRLSAEATPSGVNLVELQRRVAQASPAEVEARAGAEAEARYAIERFVMEGASVRADSRALGGDLRELALADVELRGIGGARGASAAEAGKRVLEALLARTLAQLAREQIGAYLDQRLQDLKDRASEALRDLLGPRRRE